jgi:7-keto-8-aminopelargonate synthetase-like enzyme
MVLIDDAHGAGVIGKNGKGTVEHEGLSRRQIIQTITLSKAFGTFGGAILGSRGLRKQILARSHAFIGSTPMPLPLAKAATAALTLLSSDKHCRDRLRQKTAFVRQALISAGLPVPNTPGPIVSLQPKQPRAQDVLRKSLLEAKIYPPLIVYPGAPASGYFRFVISSEHTQAQLQNLIACLAAKAELLLPLDRGNH